MCVHLRNLEETCRTHIKHQQLYNMIGAHIHLRWASHSEGVFDSLQQTVFLLYCGSVFLTWVPGLPRLLHSLLQSLHHFPQLFHVCLCLCASAMGHSVREKTGTHSADGHFYAPSIWTIGELLVRLKCRRSKPSSCFCKEALSPRMFLNCPLRLDWGRVLIKTVWT